MTRSAACCSVGLLFVAPITSLAGAEPARVCYPFTCSVASLTGDFTQRDATPHTDTPQAEGAATRNGGYLSRRLGA